MRKQKEKIERLIGKLDGLNATINNEDEDFETPSWKKLNHHMSLVEMLVDDIMTPLVFDSEMGEYCDEFCD